MRGAVGFTGAEAVLRRRARPCAEPYALQRWGGSNSGADASMPRHARRYTHNSRVLFVCSLLLWTQTALMIVSS